MTSDPRSLFWLVASGIFGVVFLAVGMVVVAELLMRGADRRREDREVSEAERRARKREVKARLAGLGDKWEAHQSERLGFSSRVR